MNSLADGACASLLQKSRSQAICSFYPIHTLHFCLCVSSALLSAQRALFACDGKPKWRINHSQPAPDPSHLGVNICIVSNALQM